MSKIQFTGDNHIECFNFVGGANINNRLNYPNVLTRDGFREVKKNDWIFKDKNGFFKIKKL